MRLARTVLVAALSLLLLAACGAMLEPGGVTPVADPPVLPERAPDIEGTVTKVMPAQGESALRLLVEAGDQKDVVTIAPATSLYREESGAMRSASAGELVEGVSLRAWYDGAVKESYPRQATAVTVVIGGER